MILAAMLALAAVIGSGPSVASFPDVPPNHWAAPAVNELRQEGILRGYPPGAAPALVVGQRQSEFTDEDRLGSTVAQLLAMGREAWLEYYAEREGQSTAAMAAAEAIFADALRVRNAQSLANASPATRNRVNRLRTSMRKYADRLIEAQRAITGGGTMWVNIEAGVSTDLEQAIDGVLRPGAYRPRPGGPKVLNPAAIDQGITRIAAYLRRERKVIDGMAPSSGMNTEQALASVAAARRELRGILKSAKGPGERAVLRFAFEMTRLYGDL